MDLISEKSKVLHEPLGTVKKITPEIKNLIEEMRKIMVVKKGVGLAANQVGKNLRIFVIEKKLADDNQVPDAYINPTITEMSKEDDEMEEGCLSLPGHWQMIKRAKKVWIKALDENGNKIRFKAKGFLARVLQHEYDHLRGVLIKDKSK
ncbi:MAG: peptide deformylase [Parcubacteria group bacterium Licking1014_17]|nr:MAG: peptide deformylase [Parcubacteria group bacterium Licking1014_17]